MSLRPRSKQTWPTLPKRSTRVTVPPEKLSGRKAGEAPLEPFPPITRVTCRRSFSQSNSPLGTGITVQVFQRRTVTFTARKIPCAVAWVGTREMGEENSFPGDGAKRRWGRRRRSPKDRATARQYRPEACSTIELPPRNVGEDRIDSLHSGLRPTPPACPSPLRSVEPITTFRLMK